MFPTMTQQELQQQEEQLHKYLKENLHALRTQYMEANAEFKVGDFIRSVQGVMKIELVRYKSYQGETWVEYCGYKYRYKDKTKVLSRTKQKEISCFNHGILIENPIIDTEIL